MKRSQKNTAAVFTEKNKKTRLKDKYFETSIMIWLPAVPLKLCRYCVTPLQTPSSPILWRRLTEALTADFSTSAQKGYIALLITDSHQPSALCRHWQHSACLPHSLCFGLYHTKPDLSRPFSKNFWEFFIDKYIWPRKKTAVSSAVLVSFSLVKLFGVLLKLQMLRLQKQASLLRSQMEISASRPQVL